MSTEVKVLSWSKGMTNIPSDSISDDDTSTAEINMLYSNGEHRPIQNEKELISADIMDGCTLIYVHRTPDYTNYIMQGENDVTDDDDDECALYYWADGLGEKVEIATLPTYETLQITAIGNTIIIASENNGMRYYLWQQSAYTYLGDHIPEPEVHFGLSRVPGDDDDSISMAAYSPVDDGVTNKICYVATDGDSFDGIFKSSGSELLDGQQDNYNALITGLYAETKTMAHEKKGFVNPFFIRYAVELYDGSYTNISVPILMMTSGLSHNTVFYLHDTTTINAWTFYQKLYYTMSYDYEGWEDIVKNVVVFASEEVDVYDTTSDIDYVANSSSVTYGCGGLSISPTDYMYESTSRIGSMRYVSYSNTDSNSNNDMRRIMSPKDEEDMISDLKKVSVFYKLAELNFATCTRWQEVPIDKQDLLNLNTMETLDDDYYSHCTLYPSNLFTYNSRLHLFNATRSFWEGADEFMPFRGYLTDSVDGYSTTLSYTIYVAIKTSTENVVVPKTVTLLASSSATAQNTCPFYYFFYPDPRAYSVMVTDHHSFYFIHDLEEHPYLNGAYFIDGIPSQGSTFEDYCDQELYEAAAEVTGSSDDTWSALSTSGSPSPESLSSQIWTSEVDNPFVFTAEGNNTIGSGTILGLASITSAISEGQFGQYPLLCFTTEGIWALGTSTEGLYSSIQPFSREVCNNADSITPTDGAVFFTSEKGLMCVAGNKVSCVSQLMMGKAIDSSHPMLGLIQSYLTNAESVNFREFLSGCRIAYDYRDSTLWIGRSDSNYVYVYSIETAAFSLHVLLEDGMQNAVNAYPDTLFQETAGGAVYSLMERPDMNSDETAYNCYLFTRSIKFGQALVLKSIQRMKVIAESADANISLTIYGANKQDYWHVHESLRGRSYKYWRFIISLEGMAANDTFSGCAFEVQPRYSHRIR